MVDVDFCDIEYETEEYLEMTMEELPLDERLGFLSEEMKKTITNLREADYIWVVPDEEKVFITYKGGVDNTLSLVVKDNMIKLRTEIYYDYQTKRITKKFKTKEYGPVIAPQCLKIKELTIEEIEEELGINREYFNKLEEKINPGEEERINKKTETIINLINDYNKLYKENAKKISEGEI